MVNTSRNDDVRGGHLRYRSASDSDSSLEDMMEVLAVDPATSAAPTVMMSLIDLLMLNAIVCGLEFCASAAFCYIPPLLLKAGISEQNMSMILGVGPALGFFLVPVIGRASDRCRSRYGRRRPFILLLSVLLVMSLFVIPYAEAICSHIVGRSSELTSTLSVTTMVVGAVLLDFSCQTCLTPCEALLSDLSHGTNQHARCFTIYSFMVSIGGCVGYLITAIDWASNPLGVSLGGQERAVFIVLIILFSCSFFLTFSAAHEVPLTDESFLRLDSHTASSAVDTSLETKGLLDGERGRRTKSDLEPNGVVVSGIALPVPRSVISGTLTSLIMSFISQTMSLTPIRSLSNVPFVLKRLALANFCSWTAIMGFNLFYTDFVGQAVYGGDPGAPEGSDLRNLYDHGVRIGSFGLLLHCINSAIYAGVVERFAAHFDLRLTYVAGMATFVVAMLLMSATNDTYVVNTMAALTGVAYATVTTAPFMLITSYHEDEKLYFYDTGDGLTTPPRGMGADLATMDSAYYLSQVVLTAFMGYIVHWTGTVLSYVLVSAAMGALACLCAGRVVASKAQMQALIKSHVVRTQLR